MTQDSALSLGSNNYVGNHYSSRVSAPKRGAAAHPHPQSTGTHCPGTSEKSRGPKTLSPQSTLQFSSVQPLICVRLCNPMNLSMPGFPVHHQLLELAQTHVHWVSDAIQPSHRLLSPFPPAFNLSQHQGRNESVHFQGGNEFSNKSVLRIRWPKYWHFSFSISPSNEYSGLISFEMDLLDLLAVQGTLKSLLQHHSSKASILWRSAFFIVQLLHPYMTTGKTIALTRQTFVGKVKSLLFNMLSRL